jgi:hypothetical protein
MMTVDGSRPGYQGEAGGDGGRGGRWGGKEIVGKSLERRYTCLVELMVGCSTALTKLNRPRERRQSVTESSNR